MCSTPSSDTAPPGTALQSFFWFPTRRHVIRNLYKTSKYDHQTPQKKKEKPCTFPQGAGQANQSCVVLRQTSWGRRVANVPSLEVYKLSLGIFFFFRHLKLEKVHSVPLASSQPIGRARPRCRARTCWATRGSIPHHQLAFAQSARRQKDPQFACQRAAGSGVCRVAFPTIMTGGAVEKEAL